MKTVSIDCFGPPDLIVLRDVPRPRSSRSSIHLSPALYHSGLSADVAAVMKRLAAGYDGYWAEKPLLDFLLSVTKP